MATVKTVSSGNSTYPYYRISGGCAALELWEVYVKWMVVITKLVPEHRPKPAGPLYMSMTNRATQQIERTQYPLLYWNSTGTTYCSAARPAVPYDRTDVRTISMYAGNYPYVGDVTVDAIIDTKLRLKVKELSSDFASYVGEYRETIGLFERGVIELVKLSTAVRKAARGRGNPLTKRQRSLFLAKRQRWTYRDAAAANLTGSWAIAPALNDLGDAMLHLNTVLQNLVVRVAATETRSKTSDVPRGGNWRVGELVSEGTISCKAVAYCQMKANARAYTAGNFAEAIWEGLPFSVLVDYFVGIGDCLSSWDALSEVSNMWVSKSYKFRMTTRTTGKCGGVDLYQGGSYTLNQTWRSVSTSIPLVLYPEIRVKAALRKLGYGLSLLLLLRDDPDRAAREIRVDRATQRPKRTRLIRTVRSH